MNTKRWLRTWVEWKWTGYRLNNFYDEVLNGSKQQQQHCMKTEDLSCPSLLHSWTSVKFLILISIRCCKNLDIWGTSAIQSFSLQSYYSKKKKCCLTVKRSRFRTGCYFSPKGKRKFFPLRWCSTNHHKTERFILWLFLPSHCDHGPFPHHTPCPHKLQQRYLRVRQINIWIGPSI